MKRIGIEVNGVLRETVEKIRQVYEKWYVNSTEETNFKYEIKEPIDGLNLLDYFSFPNGADDVYEFLYEDFPMEIFGHAPSTEYSTFNDLNDFYLSFRDLHDIIIVSDEIGKSKPATLFFLSKFSCLCETVKFYSEQTIESMWESIDILVTANPARIIDRRKNKTIIKYENAYNKGITCKLTITKLKDLNKIIEEYA
jgi:hypothetical protein